MAVNIPSTLLLIDKTLTAQNLYTAATFSQVNTSTSAVYDTVTGTYAQPVAILHTFNVVLLNTEYNSQEEEVYNVTASIMILPQNISFAPDVDQVYTIGGQKWIVSRLSLSPQNSLWEITLGRK